MTTRSCLVAALLVLVCLALVSTSRAVDCGSKGCCLSSHHDGLWWPWCSTDSGSTWGWEQLARSCIVPGSDAAHAHCGNQPQRDGSACGKCGDWFMCCNTNAGSWGWETLLGSCVVKARAKDTCSNAPNPNPNPHPPGGGGGQKPCPLAPCSGKLQGCSAHRYKGLGDKIAQLRRLGATDEFIASAMMETDAMRLTYPKCDGRDKYSASCCAGYTKYNWFMAWKCDAAWSRKHKDKDWRTVLQLNGNARREVKIYQTCLRRYGIRKFMDGHRGGETGFNSHAYAQKHYNVNLFVEAWRWTLKQVKAHKGKKQFRDCRYATNVSPV